MRGIGSGKPPGDENCQAVDKPDFINKYGRCRRPSLKKHFVNFSHLTGILSFRIIWTVFRKSLKIYVGIKVFPRVLIFQFTHNVEKSPIYKILDFNN